MSCMIQDPAECELVEYALLDTFPCDVLYPPTPSPSHTISTPNLATASILTPRLCPERRLTPRLCPERRLTLATGLLADKLRAGKITRGEYELLQVQDASELAAVTLMPTLMPTLLLAASLYLASNTIS